MDTIDPTPVVALANQKGGVGKTTTAVNLAACLTILKKHVLLIDLDPQANATSGVGMEKKPDQSIYGVLLGDVPLASRILPSPYKRLDIVPGEVDLAGAEVDVATSEHALHLLRTAIAEVRTSGHYHVILIDCPPSLSILTLNALAAADNLLIPMQCEYYALEGLTVMTGIIQRIRDGAINPGLTLEGLVMTMYDMRTNLSRQVVQEVRSHFGALVYDTMIPRSVRLGEAPSYGKPIVDYDARSAAAEAYRQLAREFVRRQWPPSGEATAQDSEDGS